MNQSAGDSPPNTNRRLQDVLASLVVFLVALPLCLGIAIACGVPPALGLMTGIIGGLVTSSLAGCRLQVSGPAAGLTVLVFDIVERHGLAALGVVVLIAGLVQVVAGLLRTGKWFRAVSPAVLHGMLAGIGVLICASQFHVMLDYKPHGSGLPNLISIPSAIISLREAAGGHAHLLAGLLGVFTLAVLFSWKHYQLDKRLHVPGALPAIAGASLIAWLFAMPVSYVAVPDNIVNAMTFVSGESLARMIEAPLLLAALTMAVVASAETLLSASAVDQLQNGPRTRYDRELIAQGVGNVLCGLVGALPMTGVIARSTVNVQAGARTRLSGVLHGAWLLIVVVAFPTLLQLVPTASLAALLVFTGVKLVDTSVIRKLKCYGQSEPAIYLSTLGMVVATDLLTGVLVGLVLSLVRLVWKMARLSVSVEQGESASHSVMTLKGTATFLGLPHLASSLETVPPGVTLALNVDRLVHIDHACLELLENWDRRQRLSGGKLDVDWQELKSRFESPADAV